MRGERLHRRARSRRCGTSSSRSPTTRSTRRTPPATAWSRTGPRTSRRTTRPSTWPRCSPRVKDDKDKIGALPHECRRMGIKVLPPDVNESDANFTPRRHRHPVRPVGDPQRRRERRRVDRRDAREAKGRFADFADFLRKVERGRLQQADRRVADQGRRVRLARPHPARAGDGARARPSTRASTPSATRRSASSTCSAARRTTDGADGGVRRSAIPAGEWDKTTLLAVEREMLGLYVSDHPLFGVEHVLAAARRLLDRPADRRRRARRRRRSSRSPASSPACSAR